jgi:glucose/arabinose dehydrogenase
MTNRIPSKFLALTLAASTTLGALAIESAVADGQPGTPVLTGRDALGDWTTDAPGVRRKITVSDLAKPYETPSAKNFPKLVKRPDGAIPQAPKGFRVSEFAAGLDNPRKIITAPNGDILVAESQPGRIKLLRDADGDGKAEKVEDFATGLNRPFGIARSGGGRCQQHPDRPRTGRRWRALDPRRRIFTRW